MLGGNIPLIISDARNLTANTEEKSASIDNKLAYINTPGIKMANIAFAIIITG